VETTQYKVVVKRALRNRTSNEKIQAQIDHLVERALGGNRGHTWAVTHRGLRNPRQERGFWRFDVDLAFEKVRGSKGGEAEYKQWEDIRAMLVQTGQSTKYNPYPWQVEMANTAFPVPTPQVILPNDSEEENQGEEETESFDTVMGDINKSIQKILHKEIKETTIRFGEVPDWDHFEIPEELLGKDSDKALAEHPVWKDLYGLGPQIRILLSNIKRAKETNGNSRFHSVLFGHAGCGKTTTLLAIEKMFGPNSVLRLDATSTTRAGLEKLFFSDTGLAQIPKLVMMEEGEKADPDALKIWLGALDDRGEIRKVNFRVNQLRQIKILFFCAVNNKSAFDKMMGSDGSTAGALSSRCVSQIYYPRPTDHVLHQILRKEIDENGGSYDWIQPCIDLAHELEVNDPRIIRSYLAGGDRLLDESYQADWLILQQAQKDFQRT
jgi:hypothetical protein